MSTENTQVTDKQLDDAAMSVKGLLAKQKKVKVRLYLAAEERQKLEAAEKAKKEVVWPYETVSINGYIFQIQRGKEVEVPQSVYDILVESNII